MVFFLEEFMNHILERKKEGKGNKTVKRSQDTWSGGLNNQNKSRLDWFLIFI